MKTIKLIVVFCCCLYSANVFAQSSPQAIESDLLRIFKKVNYYGANKTKWKAIDSLRKQNKIFAFKLKYYTSKYPETINYKFTALVKERLVIATSPDGLFRTYSWDTKLGTTGYDFDNVLQYKAAGKTAAILKMDSAVNKTTPVYWYSKIYSFKPYSKPFYFAVYNTIRSSRDASQGIQIFTIENGRLNGDVRLIKTATGFKSKLFYDYDFLSVVDRKVLPAVYFNAKTKTIYSPLVTAGGKVTDKYIAYKFNGQYFEKVNY